MELVDPNVLLELNPHEARVPTGREGWGTTEATEMITNNLFYITVKVFQFHSYLSATRWGLIDLLRDELEYFGLPIFALGNSELVSE